MTTKTHKELITRMAQRYGALESEVEEAVRYRLSFIEVANIFALSKRAYFNIGTSIKPRLQAVLVEIWLLMKFEQDTSSAFFIDISCLTTLDQAFIRKIVSLQQELPLQYVLNACKNAGVAVNADNSMWPDMIKLSRCSRTIPLLLEQMLTDIAMIPKEIKELQSVLVDLVSLCQNSYPHPPREDLTNHQPREDKNYARSDKPVGTLEPSRETNVGYSAPAEY